MKKIQLLGVLLLCFLIQSAIHGQVRSGKTNIPKGHQLYKSSKIKQNQESTAIEKPSQIRDKASDRLFYELDRTCDPMTRQIPQDILKKEESFIHNKKSLAFSGGKAKKSSSNWKNRGPFNVGGRTRALAIDITNENIILAGGVSGGLWRTENGGQNWNKVTRKFQNPSITAIVQDPRPGHQHIWYYGGGERLGNSASHNTPALYTGVGIYKSQDGGRTWELLPATVDNTPSNATPFDIVNSMVMNPTNGDLYVATFNGVHRSQDGGISFQEVLASGIDNRTEVTVTSQGKLYASVAKNGIYTSEEGINWTRISDNIFSLNQSIRTIFAINPLNEHEVFMFASRSSNNLYKYNAIDQSYIDLSDKLPTTTAPIGGLNTQGSYNMVIEIHPTNPDFIIIGGTNLFRTTDGFRTKVQDAPNNWIGGYSPKNDVSLYPDQHPDMHAVLFYPSNPNKVLNGNDGGVFVTDDITASSSFEEPVDWVSLNNGYITTQPYAVSFDPESESDDILAGFQDNGTWYTDQTDTNAFWEEQFGGDGSYNAFADNGRTQYVSSQRGNVFRLNQNESGDAVSLSWVRPAIGGSFAFITPFVLDPNNDNVMYMPAGRALLRNSNLDEIPSVSSIDELTAPTEVNWSEITKVESILTQNRPRRELNNITALDVSKFPEANKVYYGTGQGQIFRLDYADLPSSKPVDIFTGKGFPEKGFVSSIQVDPNNSNRVLVTFSNYNIPSLFFTDDAGDTWIDISGNLEENKDGTGNGPSVRWTSFLGNEDGILAGTSSGLYYANRILRENTVWQLENNQIGDGVVMQVRTRKDGLAALAVHGNGVFSKKFNVTPPRGEKTLFVNRKPEDIELSIKETPQFMTLDLSDVFKKEQGGSVEITVESSDENRDFIRYEFFNDKLEIFFFGTHSDVPNIDKEGEATIRLIATSGIQRLATEFKVRVFQKPFLKRLDTNWQLTDTRYPSAQAAENFITGEPLSIEAADLIVVPKGKTWNIERMKIMARGDDFSGANLSIPGDSARVRIYKDENGKPGEQIADMIDILRKNPVLEPFEPGEFDFGFPNTVALTEGNYWISFARLEEFYFFENIVWIQQIRLPDDPVFTNEGEPAFADKPNPHIRVVEGESFPIIEDWKPFDELPSSGLFPLNENTTKYKSQLIFSLFGEVTSLKNSKASNSDQKIDIAVYPNPSDGMFDIKFANNPNENINVRILDIRGKEIATYNFDKTQTNYSIDSSGWGPGIYIAKVHGEKTKLTTKIVRK